MTYDIDIGDGSTALDKNILADALDGTYWIDGWDATPGTGDMEVDIDAGSGAINGSNVLSESTQTVDFAGDSAPDDPRKAVISVDETGTVQKTLGNPVPEDPTDEVRFRTHDPAPPASAPGVVVAEVWLATGVTSLGDVDLRDLRVANQAAQSAAAFTETDSAVTFSEPGVDVTTTATTISDGSIKIASQQTLTRPNDTDSTQTNYPAGIVIEPHTEITELSGQASSNFQATSLYAYIKDSNQNILHESNFGVGDEFVFTGLSLSAGSEYHIEIGEGDTQEYTRGSNDSVSYPISSNAYDIVGGSNNGYGDTAANNIGSISAGPVMEGSAVVEWPGSNVVRNWDAATYNATEDGGVVAVYIEENGGSGWTEISGPIDRGQDITAASDSQVRYRVDLERLDVENDPSLDSIYRRREV